MPTKNKYTWCWLKNYLQRAGPGACDASDSGQTPHGGVTALHVLRQCQLAAPSLFTWISFAASYSGSRVILVQTSLCTKLPVGGASFRTIAVFIKFPLHTSLFIYKSTEWGIVKHIHTWSIINQLDCDNQCNIYNVNGTLRKQAHTRPAVV